MNVAAAQQNLPRRQRRHQPLEKVPQLVIGVTAQSQPRLYVKADGHFRVGVHTADHQNDGMEENQRVKQRRQRIARARGQRKRNDDNHRRHFHQPGELIPCADTGVNKHQGQRQRGEC